MIDKVYFLKPTFRNEDFPLNASSSIIPAGGHMAFPISWHDEIEIKIFKKGKAIIGIENVRTEVCAGDIVVINPYEAHENLEFFGETHYDTLIFNIHFLQSKLSRFPGKDALLYLSNGSVKIERIIRADSKITALTAILVAELQNISPQREVFLVSLSTALLAAMLESHSYPDSSAAGKKRTRDLKRLETVIKYINNNLNSTLSLDILADIAGFSPKYFSRLFKNTTQININKYINTLRLNRAQKLLLTTDNKIKEIAEEVGFYYENYFINWFKKQTGITPSRYRQAVTP